MLYGSCANDKSFKPSTSHEIPMKLLARQDPVLDQILYYDDVGLYEDELHDNGDCILNVRIVSYHLSPSRPRRVL
jgi:type 2A phosphatase activator TIP41